jgi:hypothetical protein
MGLGVLLVAEFVVVGPGAGRGTQRAERPLMDRVGQATVAGVAGQYQVPSSGGPGDRRGPGIVAAGLGVAVALAQVSAVLVPAAPDSPAAMPADREALPVVEA